MNSYCIVGCHYNGTTSLYQYMKEKKLDVIRDEGLFTLNNGHRKYGHYHKDRKPVIIIMERKKELWEKNLKNWIPLNPLVIKFEDMIKKSDFPNRAGARHGDELK